MLTENERKVTEADVTQACSFACVCVCAVEVRPLYVSVFHLGGFRCQLCRRARSCPCELLQSILSLIVNRSQSAFLIERRGIILNCHQPLEGDRGASPADPV